MKYLFKKSMVVLISKEIKAETHKFPQYTCRAANDQINCERHSIIVTNENFNLALYHLIELDVLVQGSYAELRSKLHIVNSNTITSDTFL